MLNKNRNAVTAVCLIAALSLTGCAGTSATTTDPTVASTTAENAETTAPAETAASKPLSIVCTIFPEYDWVRQIMGSHAENAEITYLLDNGVDLHSFQPTAADMIKIAECDLFIYVGGESDEWVENALAEAVNPNMQVINLMDVLGDSAKEEELKEGMQEGEHEHEHDHDHEHEEIEEEDIKDRELSDFAGNWQSLYPLLEAGELDEYVEHHAEEHEKPAEEVKKELEEKWGCDVTAVSIDGTKIEFTYADGTKKSGEYKYAEYSPILNDDGDIHAVRYQYEAVSGDSPKYVILNDHGYEPANAKHFHICYGDDADFDTTVKNFTYNPFFIPEGLDGEKAVEILEEHSHHNNKDHEHEAEGEEHEHHHEDGEVEYDEHVWLSLKNAKALCSEITSKLCTLDAANESDYKANLTAYTEKLDALDSDFQTLVDGTSVKTIVFGDRFPFRYFVDDYGLDYYAAFIGCSAETEASFETVAFLSQKVDELGVSTVFTIENSDQKIAKTIIENTKDKNQKILALNSLQSVSNEQIQNGMTYLGLMQENYDTLKEALN